MKKLFIALLCVTTAVTAGCSTLSGEAPTEPATQAPTQAQTEAQTQAPTLAPTEPATEAPTEAPTQAQPENTTFAVEVNEPITQPPTVPQTVELLRPIAGDWYLNYYEQSNGQQTTPAYAIKYTFNLNGTFSVDNRGNISTGSFYFDGTTITYKASATGEMGTFTYDSVKKQLVDVDDGVNMSAVFKRTDADTDTDTDTETETTTEAE
ncbi:MAG: hypothetical protein UD936_01170 [Acutalibacteraceae bacterium]|nr:hypothetical protein [Acutalibacteraceae bacterium]